MMDVETRLTRAFREVGDLVPDAPPTTLFEATTWNELTVELSATSISDKELERAFWNRKREARRPRSVIALVVAGSMGMAGMGVGVAAAAGAFDASPAAQQQLGQLAKNFAASSAGSVNVTIPTQATEQLLVTDTGPEGTTIHVWAASPTPGSNCFVAEVSASGTDTYPGKPAEPDGGGCGGVPTSAASGTATFRTGGGAYAWRSPTGQLYMILSSATVPNTARVTLTYSDGSMASPAVQSGWFAVGVPYEFFTAGYTMTEYSSSGTVLYTLHATQ
jgi:hypothetical protein